MRLRIVDRTFDQMIADIFFMYVYLTNVVSHEHDSAIGVWSLRTYYITSDMKHVCKSPF